MRYNEEWANNYHCIINKEQRMSTKELLSQYHLQKQGHSGSSAPGPVFGDQVSLGRSGGVRLFLYIMGILISLAAVVLMGMYAADQSYLDGISVFLGIASAILLACVSSIVAVVLKKLADLDPIKSKVLPFIGYVASGVLFIIGLACQSSDLIGWLKGVLILLGLFIASFFTASLILALTERNRVYTETVEAVCTGYVRYVSRSYSHSEDQSDWRVSMSPIFECNSAKVCYDSFTPGLNSDIAVGSKVLLHLNNEDMYRVQPELKKRVITFSSLILCFALAAILLAVLL